MPYFTVADLPAAQPMPGLRRQAVYLDDVMLTFFDFEPGAVVPSHQHPHQQITYVIEGALEFVLDGEARVLRAGEGATIPPNVPHEAVALEPTRALDGWSPIRQDYT